MPSESYLVCVVCESIAPTARSKCRQHIRRWGIWRVRWTGREAARSSFHNDRVSHRRIVTWHLHCEVGAASATILFFWPRNQPTDRGWGRSHSCSEGQADVCLVM